MLLSVDKNMKMISGLGALYSQQVHATENTRSSNVIPHSLVLFIALLGIKFIEIHVRL